MARSMGLNRRALLSLLVAVAMVIATVLVATPRSDAALGLNSFEIGADEPNDSSSAGIVGNDGGGDWASLTAVSGDLDPGEVLVINDQNFIGTATVMNPETAADDFCTTGTDNIVKGGTKIDDYPFQVISGSPSPGKNDICQVYVSYTVAGGDTILYLGVVRRETGGTTAVALELNKVSHSNRQVDDLLVTFEFDGNGPVSDLNVREWSGTQWDLVGIPSSKWDGGSYEHFGEVAVNLSTTELLPPPTNVDDCDSFSSVVPYGFAGESDNSNVDDWGGQRQVDIPRCGEIQITKVAAPAADDSYVFEWEITDNTDTLDPASGEIIDGQTVIVDVVAGEYTLDEVFEAPPYVLQSIVCDGGAVEPDAITVAIGQSVSCVITNEASAVQVVKAGAGDGGAEFDFEVTGQSDFSLSLGESSDIFLYPPGDEEEPTEVTVTETLPGGLPSWDLTSISCVDSDGVITAAVDLAGGSVTFDTVPGDLVICTFVNDQAALLTLEKDVVNDNGGTALDTEWTLAYDGVGGSDSGVEGSPAVTNVSLPAGSYDLSESGGPSGYSASAWVCDGGNQTDGDTIELAAGETATCIVTNDDIAPGLTVIKAVVNDDTGTATPDDFQLYINGQPVAQGVAIDFPANTPLTVTEDQLDGYAQTGLSCVDNEPPSAAVTHPVVLTPGQSVTCTITNDDRPAPEVTVVKVTEPTSSALFSFTLSPGDTREVPGNGGSYTWGDLAPGSYELTEDTPVDWRLENVTCDQDVTELEDGASFTLDWEDEITCVFSNGELGSLTVVKETDFETGDLFDISISSSSVNETVQLGDGGLKTWGPLLPGIYTIEETIDGFTWDIALSCSGNSAVGSEVTSATGKSRSAVVTIGLGDHITCVYFNQAALADLQVTKADDADPVSLTEDEPVAEIEYTIEVTNLGPAPAVDVVVTDTLPPTVEFVSATAEVGTCSHAAGVVTCSIGDLAVGGTVEITLVVSTEEFGSVTDFTLLNLVEVDSASPDPNPDNNRDSEPTELSEVLAEAILPFTGFFGLVWGYIALALMALGSTLLAATRSRGRHVRRSKLYRMILG